MHNCTMCQREMSEEEEGFFVCTLCLNSKTDTKEQKKLRHDAYDYECAMKYLDELGAPRSEDGTDILFSIVGRIARIPTNHPSTSGEGGF